SRGARCQVTVTVEDRGRDLFEALDEDGDGRLSLRELTRASRLLAGRHARGLGRKDVPRQLVVAFARGPEGPSFGPVPLPGRRKRTRAARPRARGPSWFRAMDANGDGFVSPGEFVGPPEVFKRLDLDGDGLISVEEAERAEARKRPGG